jgi:transposase
MKIDGRKIPRKELEKIRLEVITLVKQGMTPTEVAKKMGLGTNRVFEYLARYREGGINAIKSKKATGRPPKITASQMKWLYETITDKNPSQLKFPFVLWTRKLIQQLLKSKWGLSLSLSSIGRLLSRLGLSWQKPLKKAYEKNPDLVNKWLKQKFPYIKRKAKLEGAKIFFSDESGLRSDHQSGKTWAPIGETPEIEVTGKRFSLNLISAISNKGDIRFQIIKGRFNSDRFIDFCKHLLKDVKEKIFLIVDGHPAHKSRKVKEFIKSLQGQLSLYFLPPYSPELNPDEFVWNDIKNDVKKKEIRTKDDLKSAAFSRLVHLQKSPKKVMRFFKVKSTRYAA